MMESPENAKDEKELGDEEQRSAYQYNGKNKNLNVEGQEKPIPVYFCEDI